MIRVRDTTKLLQAAFDGGHALQKCTWRTSPAKTTRRWHISESASRGACNGDVTLAPGVGRRGAQRLPCSEVCTADHQNMASKKAALGGSLWTGRHKDICGVLGKWREVVKDGVEPDSCSADLVAFLQRGLLFSYCRKELPERARPIRTASGSATHTHTHAHTHTHTHTIAQTL
jgi:hypothetical protein